MNKKWALTVIILKGRFKWSHKGDLIFVSVSNQIIIFFKEENTFFIPGMDYPGFPTPSNTFLKYKQKMYEKMCVTFLWALKVDSSKKTNWIKII